MSGRSTKTETELLPRRLISPPPPPPASHPSPTTTTTRTRSTTEEEKMEVVPPPPPEWMLRIMRERSQGTGSGSTRGDQSCDSNEKQKRLTRVIDRVETSKLGTGGENSGEGESCLLRGRGKTTEERQEETVRDLLQEAVCINRDDSASQFREGDRSIRTVQQGGGGGELEGTKLEKTKNQEYSSSTAFDNSRSSARGGTTTASSSSASSSSAGFSSRASEASSITSDSSTTTFSLSDKDTTTTTLGSSTRERSVSKDDGRCEPVENFQGDLGISAIPPLGLGLYQSISTSPTLSASNSLYVDQSDAASPSKTISPDPLSPTLAEETPSARIYLGSRDSTIQPTSFYPSASSSSSSHHQVLLSSGQRSGSPTPSTSTLTVDRPKLPPSPPSLSPPCSSPPRPPSLKGKERAIPPPSSPPQTTITTITNASSEITSDEVPERRRIRTVDDESSVNTTVYPPENFAIVVPGIFRSSFPRKENFDFLKSLRLKSVLTLIQDEYPQENLDFLQKEGIQLFQFPIPGNKEPFVHIPDDKIVSAMAVILDSRNHPLLIHCNKGKHRTGCLVGVLRRLQTWSLTAIFEEYRRFSHPKSRQMDLQFIEAFKGLELIWDLASQNRPHLPPWACTTPYSTPHRGKVPTEAKTKERSVSRAPSGRSSPVLKELIGVGGGGTKSGWCREESEKERGEDSGNSEGGIGKGS